MKFSIPRLLSLVVFLVSASLGSAIQISWDDNSDNEEGFIIYRGSGELRDSFVEVMRVGPNITTANPLPDPYNGPTYYRVRAFNKDKFGDQLSAETNTLLASGSPIPSPTPSPTPTPLPSPSPTPTPSPFPIPVFSAPVFTTQPVSRSGYVGGSATFTVVASGNPTLQWYRSGFVISGGTAATLTISNLSSSSAGIYYAIASNAGGSAKSADATLTLLAGTPTPTPSPTPTPTPTPVPFTQNLNADGTLTIISRTAPSTVKTKNQNIWTTTVKPFTP